MTTKNVTDRIAERMDAECPLSKSIDDVLALVAADRVRHFKLGYRHVSEEDYLRSAAAYMRGKTEAQIARMVRSLKPARVA